MTNKNEDLEEVMKDIQGFSDYLMKSSLLRKRTEKMMPKPLSASVVDFTVDRLFAEEEDLEKSGMKENFEEWAKSPMLWTSLS